MRQREKRLIVVALLLLTATACAAPQSAAPTTEPKSQIANPASVFCVANQGTLEIRTGPGGGQIGVCVFPDVSECEEWTYFRGECAPASATGSPEPAAAASTSGEEHLGLEVISPQVGATVETSRIPVGGTVSPGAVVTVNDEILLAGDDGAFETTVAVAQGVSLIEVLASNARGDTEHVKLALSDAASASFVQVVPGEPTRTHRVGTVTDYVPGASLTILATDGNAYSFALTADTKILPPALAPELAVDIRATVIAPREAATSGLTATGIVVHPPRP